MVRSGLPGGKKAGASEHPRHRRTETAISIDDMINEQIIES